MNQEDKQKMRIGVYGIILREDEILLCRLSKNIRFYAGFWTLPGGGLEFGEHPEETLVREVYEETGLRASPGKLIGINNLTRDIDERQFQSIQIIYLVDKMSGSLRFEKEGTTDKCEWLKLSSLDMKNCVGLIPAALKLAGLLEE